MIHENEICPEFLFTPREDMEQDDELLKQAMDGVKTKHIFVKNLKMCLK